MRTVSFMTLGCKTNQYDTQAMREQFLRAGYAIREFDDICDVYVVNTCMVTGVGEKKSMKFVRQAARRSKLPCEYSAIDTVISWCADVWRSTMGTSSFCPACGWCSATPSAKRLWRF